MKHTRRHTASPDTAAGFSLVELLTVAGIMMVLLAVTGPAILSYLRNYQIRAGTQQVVSAIQQARNRAISKNVNLGVAFVVQDATTYWTHVEDDQSLPRTAARQALNMNVPDAVQSVRGRLPEGIEFAVAGAECPTVAGFAPADSGLRFNRLGAACDPAASALCPAVTIGGGATVNALHTTAAGSTICLRDRRSNLSRNVTVTPGGRVRFQQ
jgi:Tfp pilus assembly major pilin PilA